jgi:hypothetical protein
MKNSTNHWLQAAYDNLNIDSRYPGNFGLMPYGKPSNEDAIKYRSAANVLYDYLMASI